MAEVTAVVEELWIFPVKGCRGLKVPSARLTPTGLEFDRCWCIVDVNGTSTPAGEAISKRKMPALAKICTELSHDLSQLQLTAPGMEALRIPTAVEAYKEEEQYRVECSGKSTTTGGGWSLGFITGYRSAAGTKWINEYLNRPDLMEGSEILCSGKAKKSSYALIRAPQAGMALSSYPPIFPVLEKAKTDAEYAMRLANNSKYFSDFAPLLLTSRASAQALTAECGGERAYPLVSFRGNIIVSSQNLEPWVEESWASLEVVSKSSGDAILLRQIKPCPRCVVPCRDEATGDFIFPKEPMKLWHVLKQLFPDKFADAEWGTWAGGFFGVYFGHAAQDGVISVGDSIKVRSTRPWDAHVRRAHWKVRMLCWLAPATGVAAVALLTALFSKQRQLMPQQRK